MIDADAEREHVAGEQLLGHGQEHPLSGHWRAAGQRAAAHRGGHEDQVVLVVAGALHGELAPELGRADAVRPDAHQRHGRGGAERAEGHDEHALVLLPDEDVPALRQGEAEVPGPAVADRDGEARVGGGEVVQEHAAGADEQTAGLRARARRGLARALVVRGAVVDDVSLAAERPVGTGHLGGGDDGVQLAAVRGGGVAADVAVTGAA